MKWMRPLFVLVATALQCFLAVARAAEPAGNAPARPQPERWLLIVDTSSAMERRAKAVEGVVGELLVSGMNGQMKPGADLGIWTYNKELHAGVAPMQTWDPARSNVIAGRSVQFLSRQEYRSKGKSEPVLAELARVVSDSRQLTVVWLSDSSQTIAGTPFDDLINAAYAKYRPSLAKTRVPLVTVLRVYHGKYIGQNISVSPWPIEFPPFPIEPEKTNAIAKPVVAKPAEPVKSIYISREPEKTNVVKAAAEPHVTDVKQHPSPEVVPAVTATNQAPPVVTSPPPVVATAQPAPVPTPAPAVAEPAPVVKPPEPKPVEVTAPAVTAPKIPTPEVVAPAPTVAATVETSPKRNWPLVVGIGFLGVASVAALMLARRARRPKPISLITRSLDRDGK